MLARAPGIAGVAAEVDGEGLESLEEEVSVCIASSLSPTYCHNDNSDPPVVKVTIDRGRFA
jgi:hypothetical protein